ncbi:V-set and immunoglobulin domain-containing protein 8-like isoform X2 [Tyto alba]|uniref:V-set and immunoglobulin domain-containing protein 8-like isoform X2 n=1 Tax=Tyto alba TaxID=56313 RepID=UPI001C66BBCD|nr:V-set and immunoglobulin domain-containing protein 8-like isoform X2 [Tyto alba]
MVLVPVAALWALAPLLARADQPPVTVTAAVGEDACLPCGTQPWGHLRGVTLTCTHRAGTQHPVPVLTHRLEGHPPPEPGWHPPEEPHNRFRGRVGFCAAGPGATGVSLLLRNLSDPDFGNYSCYVAATAAAPPELLCSLVLQPPLPEVPRSEEPDMIMVVCILTAAFTAVAIGVLLCCRYGRRCCGHRARGAAQEPGAADGGGGGGGGGGRAAVALGDLKSLST